MWEGGETHLCVCVEASVNYTEVGDGDGRVHVCKWKCLRNLPM